MNTTAVPVISPREQLLRDTLCTCIEVGCVYWLRGEAQRLLERSRRQAAWHYTGVRKCHDPEDGSKFDDITLGTIELGFRRIADGTMKEIRRDLRESIITAWLAPKESDIDAEAADVILQVGLFGEIVYG